MKVGWIAAFSAGFSVSLVVVGIVALAGRLLPVPYSQPATVEPELPLPESPSTTAAPPVARSPSPAPSPAPSATPQTVAAQPPGTVQGRLGRLRISNPTDYPVRVALLVQQDDMAASQPDAYGVPAHWDFAPQEGGLQGLLVDLPRRNLKVKPGDVLVAFAQDGSRRYWGPFVIGSTPLPQWNSKANEWVLVLTP